jgi:uncharacterized OsmC-like protein
MYVRGQGKRRFAVKLTHQQNDTGPSTPALLAPALRHCLSAALMEILRRSRVNVLGCETEATAIVKPKSEAFHESTTLRWQSGLVWMNGIHMNRCAEVFGNHCTVTSSITKGIDVRVQLNGKLKTRESEVLLTSARDAAPASVVPALP